nr:MAG TPA: hypothetical protein [Caudoviricetes sp.]
MKYDCYKHGISGSFEIDLNAPYETKEDTNNVGIDGVIARSRACARRERYKQKIYNAFGEASPHYSVKLAEESRPVGGLAGRIKGIQGKRYRNEI